MKVCQLIVTDRNTLIYTPRKVYLIEMMTQTMYTNGVLIALTVVMILYGAYPIIHDKPQTSKYRLCFTIATFICAVVTGCLFVYWSSGLPVS